jgi:hypothetical protein
MTVQVQNILTILDMATQKSVSAPEISQGVSPTEERTLGENEMVVAARSARMSLAAAIFGWSERRFWNQWYWLYSERFQRGSNGREGHPHQGAAGDRMAHAHARAFRRRDVKNKPLMHRPLSTRRTPSAPRSLFSKAAPMGSAAVSTTC